MTLATSDSPEESHSGNHGVFVDVRSDGPAVTLTALTGGGNWRDVEVALLAGQSSAARRR